MWLTAGILRGVLCMGHVAIPSIVMKCNNFISNHQFVDEIIVIYSIYCCAYSTLGLHRPMHTQLRYDPIKRYFVCLPVMF